MACGANEIAFCYLFQDVVNAVSPNSGICYIVFLCTSFRYMVEVHCPYRKTFYLAICARVCLLELVNEFSYCLAPGDIIPAVVPFVLF